MPEELFPDFDAARDERNRQRTPLGFKLGGEKFTCLKVVPLGAAFDMVDAPAEVVDDESAVRALISTIDEILVEEDRERFQELMRRRTDAIDGEALLDVVRWAGVAYARRPTPPSSGSSSSRRQGGKLSSLPPGPRSAKASRRSRSASA